MRKLEYGLYCMEQKPMKYYDVEKGKWEVGLGALLVDMNKPQEEQLRWANGKTGQLYKVASLKTPHIGMMELGLVAFEPTEND